VAYNFYNAYLGIAPDSSQEYWQNGTEQLITQMQQDSINYFIIKKRNRTTKVFSDIGANIADWYNGSIGKNSDDFRKLIFAPGTIQPILGDIYEFQSYRWLVIGTDNVHSPTISCNVQRCNVQLKFLETTGAVMPTLSGTPLTIDGIVSNRLVDPVDARYFQLPDDMLMLKVANDTDTRKIKYIGTRFLLGDPVIAYKTIAIDSITDVRPTVVGTITNLNGILNIRLKSDALNTHTDNVALKVALQY